MFLIYIEIKFQKNGFNEDAFKREIHSIVKEPTAEHEEIFENMDLQYRKVFLLVAIRALTDIIITRSEVLNEFVAIRRLIVMD